MRLNGTGRRRLLAAAITLVTALTGAGIATLAGSAQAACLLLCPTTTATTPAATTTTAPSTTTTSKTTAPARAVYPGATYTGRSGSFSYIVTVDVSRNGQRISGIGVQFDHGSCSDGGRYSSELTLGGPHFAGAAISSAHTATVTFGGSQGYRAYTYDKQGHKRTGREVTSWTVKFEGNHAVGTVADHFTGGGGYRCSSGTIRFSTTRVGTGTALLNGYGVRTGEYRFKSSAGSITLVVYLPLHMVTYITGHWQFSCPHEKPVNQNVTVSDLPLPSTNTFSWQVSSHFTHTYSNGETIRFKEYTDAGGTFSTNPSGRGDIADVYFGDGIIAGDAAAPICDGFIRGDARYVGAA